MRRETAQNFLLVGPYFQHIYFLSSMASRDFSATQGESGLTRNDERQTTRILSSSAKFSAGRPLLRAYSFSATIASTFSTYRLGAVASLKVLSTEYMPRITVSIFEYRRQLKAYNFETAQHIDKRISDISFRINALQNGIKLGAIAPRGFSAT